MVVCKFFLQGECKFGDNCRFEHQIPSSTSGSNNSPFGNVQSQQLQPKPVNEVDTNTLVTSMHNDMVAVEKCGQWLLSCYAPFKEKQLFPGFQDQSFEEVRWGCYEAQRTGTFEQYKQQLQQALLEAKTRFKALQTPTKEMIAMLRTIYYTPPPSGDTHSNNQNSVFGGQPNSSIFAQTTQNSTQNASIFAQNNASTLFNQQNSNQGSIFGQNQSIFGQNSSTGGVFGQNSSTGGVFGQNSSTGGVFGQQASSVFANANQSIFNNSNTLVNNTVFQTNQPQTFPPNNSLAPQSSSIFQAKAESTQSVFSNPSPFGNMTSENAPQSTQTNPIFTQSACNSIFTQNTQSNSIFSNANPLPTQQTATLNPPVESKSIFGNKSALGNVFGGQNNMNRELYSKLEELSEADINWFKSNDLDVNNMPTKPPTYDMCFS